MYYLLDQRILGVGEANEMARKKKSRKAERVVSVPFISDRAFTLSLVVILLVSLVQRGDSLTNDSFLYRHKSPLTNSNISVFRASVTSVS